jgi:hypothetical protein
MQLRRVLSVLLLALFFVPTSAHAGGFDLMPIGTRPLGRGGAFNARADDGMALFYNPAMLADIPDFVSLQLGAGLAIWDACATRSGNYGDSFDALSQPTIFGSDRPGWADTAFPSVCNSGDPQVIPSITATFRILPELTLALGVWTPGGVGQGRFGSVDGTVTARNGELAPSPTRYAVTDRNLLLFAPSVGIGWRPADWLRVGFTFQWGMASVDFTNYTSVGGTGEDPSNDIRTRLQVFDAFVPAGILSVHVVPHPNVDVMLGGRISDSVGGVVDASGTLTLGTGVFGNNMPGSSTPTTSTINGTTLDAGQPFQFMFGFRYSDRIRRRAYEHGPLGDTLPQVDDPMWTENFDIELDVNYLHLAQVGDFVISNPAGSSAVLQRVGNAPTNVPLPTTLPLPHGWSDALQFRLGGDVNIVPGTFAVRAGASFELPLNDAFVRYAQNDFMQGWNLGLFLGATLRIERFDVSAAYGHVFAETVTVSSGNYRGISATNTEGQCTGDPAYDPANPVVSRGCYPSGFGGVVNNGTYTQELNVFSLALAYHFD